MAASSSFLGAALRTARHMGEVAAAAGGAVLQPDRGDLVAAVGELTAGPALRSMVAMMMQDRHGRAALARQMRVTDATLVEARAAPPGSFGAAYAAYMDIHGFLPSGRLPVRFVADPFEAYAMTRYRECHDYLHAVLGCSRTVADEVALKVFEFAQTGLPLGALAIAGGAPHLTAAQRSLLVSEQIPWAMRHRPRPHDADGPVFFLNVPWETLLATPHAAVLSALRYEPMPGRHDAPWVVPAATR